MATVSPHPLRHHRDRPPPPETIPEDAGAAAIAMPSLVEEDIIAHHHAPGQYLEHRHRVKQRVRVPVIGSLNGTAPEGWLHYGRRIQEAGADAFRAECLSRGD